MKIHVKRTECKSDHFENLQIPKLFLVRIKNDYHVRALKLNIFDVILVKTSTMYFAAQMETPLLTSFTVL